MRNIVRHRAEALLALAQCFFGLLSRGDIVQAIDRADDPTLLVLEHAWTNDDMFPRAILLFEDQLAIGCRHLFAAQDSGNRILVVGHRSAVGIETRDRAAELLRILLRPASPQIHRAMIVFEDVPLDIGRINRHRHELEERLVTCRAGSDLFLRLFSLFDIDERRDHTRNPVLVAAIRSDSRQMPGVVLTHLHFPLDGHQVRQHFLGVVDEPLVFQSAGNVRERTAHIGRDEIENFLRARSEPQDAQAAIEEDGSDIGRGH